MIFSLAFLGLATMPGWECRDDSGRDFCDVAVQQRVLENYRASSLAEYAERGAYVRRALIVDGYGQDLVLIEFIREQGSDPFVRLSAPGSGTYELPIGEEDWARAVSESSLVHFKLVDPEVPPQQPGQVLPPCLHSWLYWVETLGQGDTRSIVQDACRESTSATFAWWAATFAAENVPICSTMDRRRHRTVANMLNRCMMFTGDRAAAAAFYNSVEGQFDGGIFNPQSYRFYRTGKLEIEGASLTGSEAQQSWDALEGTAQSFSVSLEAISAKTPEIVDTQGRLLRYHAAELETPSYDAAPLTARWTRDVGDRYWRLDHVAVGTFAEWTPPTE